MTEQSFQTQPPETFTIVPVPAPMTAWVIARRFVAEPRARRDVDVLEYPVVGARVRPDGSGEYLIQSSPHFIEATSELEELTSGEGVLVAVLPTAERPDLEQIVPVAIRQLAALYHQSGGKST